MFFTCFCAGVVSESEYDDYYEYYDEKEQKISAEWKTLATEMFEGMSSNLITVHYKNYNYYFRNNFFEVIWRIDPTKVRPFQKIKILKFDNNEICSIFPTDSLVS